MKKNLLALFALLLCGATALAQAPTNGLVGYYGFEGNANSHNLLHNFSPPTNTEVPAVSYQNGGKIGKGAAFFGYQALLNTTLNDIFDANTPFTVSYWYKDSDDMQNTYGTQVELFGSFLCRYQGSLMSEINTTGGYLNFGTSWVYPSLGEWRHVTLIYDPASNMPISLWLNGSRLDFRVSAARMIKPFVYAVIGNGLGSNGSLHPQKGYKGMIDELFIYNRVLTATEIESVMGNTQSINAPMLSAVSSTNIGNTSADITYMLNANSASTTSIVKYGTSASALANSVNGVTVNGTDNNSMLVTLTNLSPNTTYYYSVSATNANGTVLSQIYNFTTANALAPAVPITYVNNLTFGSANINYFITPNTITQVSYHIEYGAAPEQLNLRTDDLQITANQQFYSYTPLYGLNEQTTYYYRVAATSENGTGYSETGSFTTLAAPVYITIDPVTVTDVTETTAKVNYSLNQGIGETSVILSYGTSEADLQEISVPGSNGNAVTNSYTITNLQPGTDYYCSLRATNTQTTGYSAYVSFTTATLATDINTKVKTQLVPNPATNFIRLITAEPAKSVYIYNLQGQLVLTASGETINVSGLQAGAYIVKVLHNNDTQSETRLLKN